MSPFSHLGRSKADRSSCDVDPRNVAVWWCERYSLKLSVEAAAALIGAQKLHFADLEPYRECHLRFRGL